MQYTFLLVGLHPKVPELRDWLLLIRPEDVKVQDKVFTLTAQKHFLRSLRIGYEPTPSGFDRQVQLPESDVAVYDVIPPVELAARVNFAQSKYLMAGHSVLLNAVGGWMLRRDATPVYDRRESDRLEWPKLEENPNEIISVHRFGGCAHYYLVSSAGRMFDPNKHDSYAAAEAHALRYVPPTRVRESLPTAVYGRDGD